MAKAAQVRVDTRNPNTGRSGPRIAQSRYDPLRRAILAAVPTGGPGVTFGELFRLVRCRLPAAPFRGASVQWYFTVVKLDLEARGLLRRVGDRPHRLLRGGPPRRG